MMNATRRSVGAWTGRGAWILVLTFVGIVAAQDPPGPAPLDLTAEQQQWLDEHPVIRLGPYRNYPPAEWLDEDNTHLGIAADYVDLVEQMLGVEFEPVYTETWTDLLNGLRDRTIDINALAADVEDRRAYLSFTRPYLELPAVIITRTAVEKQLLPSDLAGMRVSVVEGYAVQNYLETEYPDIELDLVQHTNVGLEKVSLGVSDAFISDLAVASYYIQKEGISNLRLAGETGFVYRMGFTVRNDWPELLQMIDQALAQVTPEQHNTIFQRWITLSHQTEFASKRRMQTLLLILGAILLVVIVILIWNRTLQLRVQQRTQALKEELVERRRAVEALKESEERIRKIIATALDAVVTMDADGMVTGWSEQAAGIFGWNRDEVVGKSLADFIIPEQYRAQHAAGLERYKTTGVGAVLNRRFEITALRRDGTEFPVEISIAPIPRQHTVEFSAFVRDITKRCEDEAELERHREQLEELVVERTKEMRLAKEAAESAEAQLANRVVELERALAEVKQLRGLLPICSYCKRIREGEDYKRSIEAYLADHSDAQFSHGVCPDCYDKHMAPQIDDL